MNESATLKVISLNCRGLHKTANPLHRNQMIRYLRSQEAQLVALQEIQSSPQNHELYHRQFLAQDSLWTHHCGLLSLSPNISLTRIPIPEDTRAILAEVSHSSNAFLPLHVLVVYAPAHSPSMRNAFFQDILTSLTTFYGDNAPERLIVMGDFNYSPFRETGPSQIPILWQNFLCNYFIDGITSSNEIPAPTFRRGATTRSTIDYVFSSKDLDDFRYASSVDFVNSNWTDHAMLAVTYVFENPSCGKGLWRANPLLARQPAFRQQLATVLTTFHRTLDRHQSVQDQWDMVKTEVGKVCRKYSRKYAEWRQQQLTALQRKRNRLLRSRPPISLLAEKLPILENQISALQAEIVDIAALRAGQRWRENGETSAGYLKRTITQQARKRAMPVLRHPVTDNLCPTPETMQQAVSAFYTCLYSPEESNDDAVRDLLAHIPIDNVLSEAEGQSLCRKFTIEDLCISSRRTPRRSSPGPDGLPYEILFLVFRHPLYANMLESVYNDALTAGVYPSSWQQTCMRLLPKKGDLTSLKNWRPIALINCDAKVFTRLLNSRILTVANKLITGYQTGFIPGRFIADNGLTARLAMEQAQWTQSSEIGLLLDQEKAYDRVHPNYLAKTLEHFGFPESLRKAILNLFFGTNIRINVNGFLTSPVPQKRGLRQGDPLSPVLFNLAFEPFLQRILTDDRFSGFQPLPRHDNLALDAPAPLKILAYADDALVFLKDLSDFQVLQEHLATYSKASNAKINIGKTVAFSLSGNPSEPWQFLLQDNGISAWHDRNATQALVYLGFPLTSHIRQRDAFCEQLLEKVKTMCHIHSQRSLSILGRATVTNSLILATVWHVLRLLPVPKSFFSRLCRITGQFLKRSMFPAVKYALLCAPKNKGGVGILNPGAQQQAMQLRWIGPLLHAPAVQSFAHRWLSHYLHHGSKAPDPLAPILFKECRKGPMRSSTTTSGLLLGTCDYLPRDMSAIPDVTIATCLTLPLSATCTPSETDPPRCTKISSLTVHDAYTFEPSLGILRLRLRRERSAGKNRIGKHFKDLQQGRMILHRFFQRRIGLPIWFGLPPGTLGTVDFCPFLKGIDFSFDSSPRCSVSQRYREVCSLKESTPTSFSQLNWKRFWRLKIQHRARTVWYRALCDRLPNRERLHRLIPDTHPSTSCSLCGHVSDSLSHFLFACPRKWPVWNAVWHAIFQQEPSHTAISDAIMNLTFPPNPETLASEQVISSTLVSIWDAYWRHIFDDVPFSPSSVAQTALRLAAVFTDERTLGN